MTRYKLIFLFVSIFLISFIDLGMAEPPSWHYIEETHIENGIFDSSGNLINGTLFLGEFENGTWFDAVVVNYELTNVVYYPGPEKPTIDLVPMAEKINSWMVNPYFWVIICILFAIMFRAYYHMMHEPFIWLRDFNTLKSKGIGRFIKEEPLNETGIWRYVFKDSVGVHLYYGDRSLTEYAPFCFTKLMQIWHFYPDLVITKLNVPEGVIIESHKIANTFRNALLRIPYAFCVLLSLISLSVKIYDKFTFITGNEKQIPYIINLHMMEQMDLRFDVQYEKFELNSNGVQDWNRKSERLLPLSEIFAIQKNPDKIRNFTYLDLHKDSFKYRTIHECVKDIRTRLMDRAYYESKKLYYEKAVQSTYDLYKKVAEEMTTLKLSEEERFHEAYSKIDAINTDRNNSLPELLSLYTKNRTLGMDELESIKRAVLTKVDQEYGVETAKKTGEIAELKGKLSAMQMLVKGQLDNIKNNAVNVRHEYDVEKSQQKTEESEQ